MVVISLSIMSLFLVFLLIAKFQSPDAGPSAGGTDAQDERDARMHAREFVKQCLKYPDDADFGWASAAEPMTGPTGRTNWVCAGTVTAPNDLGAKLTHEWQALLCKEDNTWQTISLRLDGKYVYVNAELIKARAAEVGANAKRQKTMER